MAKTRKIHFKKSRKKTRKRKNRIQRGGERIWKLIIEAYKHCYLKKNLSGSWSDPLNLPKISSGKYKKDPMIGEFTTASSSGVNYPHISKHDRGIQLSVGSGKQVGKGGIESSSDNNVVVSNFEGITDEEKIINWLSDCIMYFNEIAIQNQNWIDVLTCMRTYLCNEFKKNYPESTLPVACTAMDTFRRTITFEPKFFAAGAVTSNPYPFGSDQTSLTSFVSDIKKCDNLATLIKNIKAQQDGAESKINREEIKELFFQIFRKTYSYKAISDAVVGNMDDMVENIKKQCEIQKTQIFTGEPKKILALIGLFYNKNGELLDGKGVITKVKKALGFEKSGMKNEVKMKINEWLNELFIPPKGIKFIRNHLLSLLMFLNESGGFSDNDTLSKANQIKSKSMTSPVFAKIAEIFYTYKWGNAKKEKGKKIFDEAKKKTAEVRVSLEAVDTSQRENVWRDHYENDEEANAPVPQLSEGRSWGQVLNDIYGRGENEANPPYRIADNEGGGLCLLYSMRDALRDRGIEDVPEDINDFSNKLIQGLVGYVGAEHSIPAIRTAVRIVISLFPQEGAVQKRWQMSYEDGFRSLDILRNAGDPNAQSQEAIRIISFAITHLADNWTLVAEELFQFINMVAAHRYNVTVNIIQQNADGDYVEGARVGNAPADRQIYLALGGRHYRAIVQNAPEAEAGEDGFTVEDPGWQCFKCGKFKKKMEMAFSNRKHGRGKFANEEKRKEGEKRYISPLEKKEPRFALYCKECAPTNKVTTLPPGYITGTVIRWIANRGYGFIKGSDGKEYYLHVTQLSGFTNVNKNMKVYFEKSSNGEGPAAKNVHKDNRGGRKTRKLRKRRKKKTRKMRKHISKKTRKRKRRKYTRKQ